MQVESTKKSPGIFSGSRSAGLAMPNEVSTTCVSGWAIRLTRGCVLEYDEPRFARVQASASRFMKRGLRAMQLLLDMQLKHEVLVWWPFSSGKPSVCRVWAPNARQKVASGKRVSAQPLVADQYLTRPERARRRKL